jgi:hypothetical protein
MAIANEMEAKRQQKEQATAQKKRIKELEALAPKAAQTWDRVLDLIQIKQAYAYDEATKLLRDLRDLAEHQGSCPPLPSALSGSRQTTAIAPP